MQELEYKYVTGNAVTDVILNKLLDNAVEACEKREQGKGLYVLLWNGRNRFYWWKLKTALMGVYPCRRTEI